MQAYSLNDKVGQDWSEFLPTQATAWLPWEHHRDRKKLPYFLKKKNGQK